MKNGELETKPFRTHSQAGSARVSPPDAFTAQVVAAARPFMPSRRTATGRRQAGVPPARGPWLQLIDGGTT